MNDNDLFEDMEPGETRIMPVEEYERLQKARRQKIKLEKEQEEFRLRAEKAEFKRLLPIRNNLPYDDNIANEICERISAGELLINMTNEPHMPTIRRTNQWLRDNPEFNQLYNQSIADRLSIFEEQVVQIADDVSRDYKEVQTTKGAKRVLDPEVIARAKLRVDVRFRHLKAGKPTKWGESSTLKVQTDDELDPSNFTHEELERQIADIERKSRIVKPV
jgi:hypothetical protein